MTGDRMNDENCIHLNNNHYHYHHQHYQQQHYHYHQIINGENIKLTLERIQQPWPFYGTRIAIITRQTILLIIIILIQLILLIPANYANQPILLNNHSEAEIISIFNYPQAETSQEQHLTSLTNGLQFSGKKKSM